METDSVAKKLGLESMDALDVASAHNTSDMLRRMGSTAFTGRCLGEAADVFEGMLRNDCFVVMTLTGAMTMAGLNRLIIEMLSRGWVNCIVSTGALVGHGLVEDLGMRHYKHSPAISDEEYYRHRLNRVYDVLEPEDNLDRMEVMVRAALDALVADREDPLGTFELLKFIGSKLPGDGVLQTAAKHDVDVFIPAFTDSELGLDFAVHGHLMKAAKCSPLRYDGFRDLDRFCVLCQDAVASGRELAIFTIGGGVPRNWAQQVGPYIDVRNKRLGRSDPGIRYKRGIRICPDPVHYGHLSGCTYSEGVSWGKFVPKAEGGQYAEVLLDATVAWPLLVRAMIDRGF